MIKGLHITFALMSAWRIVELFLMDRITAKLRDRFPSYLWQCPRCLSVWAGTAATVMYLVYPWLNWPFAISWMYLVCSDWIQAKYGRRFVVSLHKSGQWTMERNELTTQEIADIFQQLSAKV